MNTTELPFAHGALSFLIVAAILMVSFVGPMMYFRWKKWV